MKTSILITCTFLITVHSYSRAEESDQSNDCINKIGLTSSGPIKDLDVLSNDLICIEQGNKITSFDQLGTFCSANCNEDKSSTDIKFNEENKTLEQLMTDRLLEESIKKYYGSDIFELKSANLISALYGEEQTCYNKLARTSEGSTTWAPKKFILENQTVSNLEINITQERINSILKKLELNKHKILSLKNNKQETEKLKKILSSEKNFKTLKKDPIQEEFNSKFKSFIHDTVDELQGEKPSQNVDFKNKFKDYLIATSNYICRKAKDKYRMPAHLSYSKNREAKKKLEMLSTKNHFDNFLVWFNVIQKENKYSFLTSKKYKTQLCAIHATIVKEREEFEKNGKPDKTLVEKAKICSQNEEYMALSKKDKEQARRELNELQYYIGPQTQEQAAKAEVLENRIQNATEVEKLLSSQNNELKKEMSSKIPGGTKNLTRFINANSDVRTNIIDTEYHEEKVRKISSLPSFSHAVSSINYSNTESFSKMTSPEGSTISENSDGVTDTVESHSTNESNTNDKSMNTSPNDNFANNSQISNQENLANSNYLNQPVPTGNFQANVNNNQMTASIDDFSNTQAKSAPLPQDFSSNFVNQVGQDKIAELERKIKELEERENKFKTTTSSLQDALREMTASIEKSTKDNKKIKEEISTSKEKSIVQQKQIAEKKIAQARVEERQKIQRQQKQVQQEQQQAANRVAAQASSRSFASNNSNAKNTPAMLTSAPESNLSTQERSERRDEQILLNLYKKSYKGISLNQFNEVKGNPKLLKKHYSTTPQEIIVNTLDGQVLIKPIEENGEVVEFKLLGEVSNEVVLDSLKKEQKEIEKEKKQIFSYITIQENLAAARNGD